MRHVKDLNNWQGIGRATKDAVITTSHSGMTVCKFSIASNGYKEGEVSFFNCVLFGKFAEGVGRFITKGKQLAIQAELKQNKWVDKNTGQNRYTIELVVSGLQLLGGGQSAQATEQMFKEQDSSSFNEDLNF